MAECLITRTPTGGMRVSIKGQLGIYPIGSDGRPSGNVIVPEGVSSLYRYLFSDDASLITVQLPSTLTEISSYAFYNCANLESVELPDSIRSVLSYAFQKDTKLASVSLSKNLTEIGNDAFEGCVNLSVIQVPDEMGSIYIGQSAFHGCNKLDNETITKLASRNTEKNNALAPYMFSELTGISEITINKMGDFCFYGCTNLKRVTVLGTLNGRLGNSAFCGCSNLKSVILPADTTTFNDSLFRDCISLTGITIPEGVTSIENNAFLGCALLSTIHIPKNVTKIGTGSNGQVFCNCKKLSNITFDESAHYTLGGSSFAGCDSLSNEDAHNIIEHADSADTSIFSGCTGLTDVNVAYTNTQMFYQCTNLQRANIGSRNTQTGSNVFYGCTSLQEVSFAEGITTIGSAIFRNCSSLKKVYLPASITTQINNSLSIAPSNGNHIFCGCPAIEDVRLGTNWNMNLNLSGLNNLTHESVLAMFNSLKDLTGEAKKTLTLGSTMLANFSDEEKAIAANKNWNLV